MKRLIQVATSAAVTCLALLVAQQEDEDFRTRRVWDLSLQNKRPAPKHSLRTSPETASAQNAGDAYVGVTLWRLRPSKLDDEPAARMLVHQPVTDKDEDWTPVRCEVNTPLSPGEMVRLSVESARTGYLYIADREKYGDGTYSDADLIFPTLHTHHGKNNVMPGEIIEVPSWDDSPRYFVVRRTRSDQVAEVLTLIVSPEPIKYLRIGTEPVTIPNEQLTRWEKTWGGELEQLDAPSEQGKAYTKAEADAGKNRTVLNANDPLPQTMFHVKTKEGEPLLVTVPLRMK
jgi:hypothetical protein